MANTIKRNYPLAGVNDAPDGPLAIQRLGEAVDLDVDNVVRGATRRVGRGTAAGVLLTSNSVWADLGTVTGQGRGKPVQALWTANYANQNSGAHKNVTYRILLDTVEVQRWDVDAPFRSGETVWMGATFDFENTPSGTLAAPVSHTWKLQALPSGANSVTIGSTSLRVTEFAA